MTDHDHAVRIVDTAMIASGSAWTLAQWSDFAGELTPILSALFVTLSIAWLMIRVVDRFRFGPSGGRSE